MENLYGFSDVKGPCSLPLQPWRRMARAWCGCHGILLPGVPALGAGEQPPLQADSGGFLLPCPLPCGCTEAVCSTPCST